MIKKADVFIKSFLVFLLALLLQASPARALQGEWQAVDQASLRFIASNRATDDGALYLGMQLKLKEGWDSYWRSPGDAGFPPTPDWKGSANLAKATLLYPWPTRYEMQGLETYGYKNEVIFPIKIEKTDAAAALDLKMGITLLTCAAICLPATFNIAIHIPADFYDDANSQDAQLLKNWLARVPKQDDGQGLTLQAATLKDGAIDITYQTLQPFTDADVIVEVGDGSTVPVIGTDVQPDRLRARLDVKADVASVINTPLIFTLVDKTNSRAVEKNMVLTGVWPAPSTQSTQPSLLVMVFVALLGGLILNLMPCVLPVLALKSLSFIQHGGGTPSGVRLSFLVTSAGIIFSFLVMAAALVGLKTFGMSVGWGVQFQHPIFLIFLIAVLGLFAFNLFGLYEIPLPRFLADRLSWTQGHGNLWKDFASGAFATLLATPCTAPFLGTAVGFALAGGAVEIFTIFTALGFGLALPFLLIAAFPKMATLLPRPGQWMNGVRTFLGVILLVTAVWLGFVLAMQLKPDAPHAEANWQVFDESKIPALIAEDKIILVDVTADWCLTCQVNKRFVLDTDDMKKTLSDSRIILMKADWTKRDEAIAAYLRSFGRYGIPFNVLYSKAMPNGQPLPELLSKESVLKGLADAGLAKAHESLK